MCLLFTIYSYFVNNYHLYFILLDYICYKIYKKEYDNEIYICVDMWDKKTKKATGFKISTYELNTLNMSEDSFRFINRSYMRLFNRLCYDGDVE